MEKQALELIYSLIASTQEMAQSQQLNEAILTQIAYNNAMLVCEYFHYDESIVSIIANLVDNNSVQLLCEDGNETISITTLDDLIKYYN